MEPATAAKQNSGESNTRLRLRKLWLVTHRWLGLTVGLLFVLLGLTGSLLVFDHAIDEWLNPELLLTAGSGSRRPIDEIITAAETEFADGTSQAVSVTRPRIEHGVWTVWFRQKETDALRFVAVHVDPFTAEVTGQRVWGEYLMSWLYRLHYNLLADQPGAIIVGLAGLILIVSLVSGIILWWPLWKRSWRAALAIRRGRRLQYDLHKSVGILSAAVLLVICFTGAYMEFPTVFRGVVTLLFDESPHPEDSTSRPAAGRPGITAAQAVEIARRRFPEARFDHLHPPRGEDGVYEVAVRQPNEVQQSYGRTQVFIDRYSGDVLAVHSPEDFTAADAFFAWQFPLHNGEAFGLVGRWIVLVSGLSPGLLYVTGFVLWRRRRTGSPQTRSRGADNQTVLQGPAALHRVGQHTF